MDVGRDDVGRETVCQHEFGVAERERSRPVPYVEYDALVARSPRSVPDMVLVPHEAHRVTGATVRDYVARPQFVEHLYEIGRSDPDVSHDRQSERFGNLARETQGLATVRPDRR